MNQTHPCNHCWPLSVRFQKGWSFSLTSLCPDHKPILKLMAHETIYKSIQRCRSESAAPKGVGAKCELIWAVTSPEHLLRYRHHPRSGASTDWANSLPAGKNCLAAFCPEKSCERRGRLVWWLMNILNLIREPANMKKYFILGGYLDVCDVLLSIAKLKKRHNYSNMSHISEDFCL